MEKDKVAEHIERLTKHILPPQISQRDLAHYFDVTEVDISKAKKGSLGDSSGYSKFVTAFKEIFDVLEQHPDNPTAIDLITPIINDKKQSYTNRIIADAQAKEAQLTQKQKELDDLKQSFKRFKLLSFSLLAILIILVAFLLSRQKAQEQNQPNVIENKDPMEDVIRAYFYNLNSAIAYRDKAKYDKANYDKANEYFTKVWKMRGAKTRMSWNTEYPNYNLEKLPLNMEKLFVETGQHDILKIKELSDDTYEKKYAVMYTVNDQIFPNPFKEKLTSLAIKDDYIDTLLERVTDVYVIDSLVKIGLKNDLKDYANKSLSSKLASVEFLKSFATNHSLEPRLRIRKKISYCWIVLINKQDHLIENIGRLDIMQKD